ncbi:hypothetical protein D3C76_1174400 [compost metagenome]
MQGVAFAGLALAIGGFIALLLPGASAPAPSSAAIRLLSGIAWAAYSLIGKRVHDPLASTTGNLLLAVPILILSEPLTSHLILTSLAVLGGIGLVLSAGHSART